MAWLLAASVLLLAFHGQERLLYAAQPQRPNVLWITLEDTSPDLGCYGDTYAVTPRIDRLAREGVRFTRFFSHAGVCAPSRSGIITGMYPTSIGTHHMRCQGVPPAYVRCFPEYLRAAGYYCTNNAKTDYNFAAPRTAWDESSNQADWRGRAEGQPFFSVINIATTHEGQIRAPARQTIERLAALTPAERHDPAQAILPSYYPDSHVIRRDWATYHDLVTAADRQVGEILDRLEADGLADGTIVFFFADHGRGLSRCKRWLYDSGIRAPLIVRWPGKLTGGTVCDDLVAFIDLAPTVLSLAGVEVPKHMQGQVFLGDAKAAPRQYVFAARDRMDETYDRIRAVRDKRFKYLRNDEPQLPYAQPIQYMDQMPTMQELRRLNAAGQLSGSPALFFRSSKPSEELFDTEADPDEVNDLAGRPEYQEVLLRMRAVLDNWTAETHDLGGVPEAELWEKMRPGGVYAKASAPQFDEQGGEYPGPIDVTLSSPTEGASIAYTLDEGESPRWLLYSGPIRIARTAKLRAVACRLGYQDSPVAEAEFSISTE